MGYHNPEAPFDRAHNARRSQQKIQDTSGVLGKLTGEEIVDMARTKSGSTSLQKILNVATAVMMLDRITGLVFDLMNNMYACFVFQRLLVMCTTQEQFEKIVSELIDKPDQLISAAKTKFGSHSLMKLLQSLKEMAPSLVGKVMAVLEQGVLLLLTDFSGRRLIIDCMSELKLVYNCQPIYVRAVEDCIGLANDKEGYHVVIKLIETIPDAPLRKQLLMTIADESVVLASHPNGTFVLQKVILLHDPTITEIICTKLQPDAVRLGTHRVANYVIQMCVETTTGMKLLAPAFIQSDKLIKVTTDQYGNYILQKILEKSKTNFPHLYQELRNGLVLERGVLENHPSGRNVLKYL